MPLRPYQQEILHKLRDAMRLYHSPLLVLPTGCVSGDTKITINRARTGVTGTIEWFYRNQHNPLKRQGIQSLIRSALNNRIGLQPCLGITHSGQNMLLELVLKDGTRLKATPDHQILTPDGWFRLDSLATVAEVICDRFPQKRAKHQYRQVQGLRYHPYCNRTESRRFKGNHIEGRLFRVPFHRLVMEAHLNGLTTAELTRICRSDVDSAVSLQYLDPDAFVVHHRDRNERNNSLENLETLTHEQHQQEHALDCARNFGACVPVPILSVEEWGVGPTYDAHCGDPFHNFIANGIVVHNSGKGTIEAEITKSANAKGSAVISIVNRREIVKDKMRRLEALGLHPGLIMGSESYGRDLPLQVASLDTLVRRRELPPAKLVLADEAHFCCSKGWQSVLTRYRESGAYVVGMTATPVRADGRGLGEIFQHIVLGPSVKQLIASGDLVPAHVYAPAVPDLGDVHTIAGDYNQHELGAKMDKPKLVGDVVDHWKRLAIGRPTVVFAVNCRHAENIAKEFSDAGIRARAVDSTTPSGERDTTWQELSARRFSVVVSVGIISYGWDCPAVSCAILARPTKSLQLYLQQVGRVLRPAADKEDALILDHAGNALRHGFPDDDRVWTLDGRATKPRAALPPENLPRVCPECFRVWPHGTRHCECGYEFSGPAPIMVEAGELQEVTARPPHDYSRVAAGIAGDEVLESIVRTAKANGYKPGWVMWMRDALNEQRIEFHRQFGKLAPRHLRTSVLRKMIEARRA